MRILVIEDDEANIRVIKLLLGRTNLPVCVAKTKQHARELFQLHSDISVILVDGWLEGERTDTCDLIQEMRCMYNGPMIAMSACDDTRAKQVIAGCDEVAPMRTNAVAITLRLCQNTSQQGLAA